MKIVSNKTEIVKGHNVLVRDRNNVTRTAKVLDIDGKFVKFAIQMGNGVKLIDHIRYE